MGESRKVVIRDQVRLGLSKCIELVTSGIRFRLFRAAITVAIIAMAVAFLMTMLSESLVARRIAGVIDSRTAPRREMLFWVNRLSAPMTEAVLTSDLAAASPDSRRWLELAGWGGLSDADLKHLHDVAVEQAGYTGYFEDELPEPERRRMVGRQQGTGIFRALQDGGNFAAFQQALKQSDRPMGGSIEDFQRFLADWRQTEPRRQKIIAAHGASVEGLRKMLGDRTVTEALAAGDDALLEQLAANGFLMSRQELESVGREAAVNADAERLTSLLTDTEFKRKFVGYKNIPVSEAGVDLLLATANSAGGAKWIAEAAKGASLNLSASRVREVAAAKLAEADLAEVEASVSRDAGKGFLGFSTRTLWLIVVSFLVCIVGIANAMLMSVTERFREIATMKCLGAKDEFIMINFILESVLQGAAGGVLGAVLGFVLGGLCSWAKFGWMAVQQMPLREVLAVGGGSMAAGVVISALAAVYPAWVAARLAPMEAMRIE